MRLRRRKCDREGSNVKQGGICRVYRRRGGGARIFFQGTVEAGPSHVGAEKYGMTEVESIPAIERL